MDCKVRAKLEEMLDEAKRPDGDFPGNMDRLKAALVRLDELGCMWPNFCGMIPWGRLYKTHQSQKNRVRIASFTPESMLSRPDFSMADARFQYPAYGMLFADKASVKGVINMDLAYYKEVLQWC